MLTTSSLMDIEEVHLCSECGTPMDCSTPLLVSSLKIRQIKAVRGYLCDGCRNLFSTVTSREEKVAVCLYLFYGIFSEEAAHFWRGKTYLGDLREQLHT